MQLFSTAKKKKNPSIKIMILETKSILYILVKIINTAFKVYSHSLNLVSLPQMIFPTAMCVPCCLGYLFLPLSLLFEPAEKYYMEFNYKRKSQRKKREREKVIMLDFSILWWWGWIGESEMFFMCKTARECFGKHHIHWNMNVPCIMRIIAVTHINAISKDKGNHWLSVGTTA